MYRIRVTIILIFLLVFSFPPTLLKAYAEDDAIATKLKQVMPDLVLPESHPRLDVARKQVFADWAIQNGFTGQGVSVALIDGGIQSKHVQFDGRIIAEVCTQPDGDPYVIWKCKDGATTIEGPGVAEAIPTPEGEPTTHGLKVRCSTD